MSTDLVQPLGPIAPAANLSAPDAAAIAPPPGSSFAQWLLSRVDKANHDLVHADAMAQAFAVDDSVPVHQVTYALEQARISLEVMLQVRNRLVESYQELFRMQL